MFSPLGFFAISAVLFVSGAIKAARTRRVLRRGVITTGSVSRLVDDNDGFSSYVRFSTEDGREIEFHEPLHTLGDDWTVGAPCQVIYLREAPEGARVHRPGRLWQETWLLLGGAALALVLGAVVLGVDR